MAYQHFNADVENNFHDFWEQNICYKKNWLLFCSTGFVFPSWSQLIFFVADFLFSKIMKSVLSELKCWLAMNVKSAVSIEQSTCSILSFSTTAALNSSVRVWNDVVVLFDDFYVNQSPILFFGLQSSWPENAERSIWFSCFADLQTENFYKSIQFLFWCIYDPFNLRPIDRKYRSATALFVHF